MSTTDQPTQPQPSRSRLRHPLAGRGARRPAAGLALLVVVLVAVAVGLALGTRSSSNNRTRGIPVAGTAKVARRELVETDTESGTISHADPQTVYNRISGTITWLPSVGQLIKPGQPLYEIDGRPVVLMNGTTPAYRNLSAGASDGRDILQLNRNLVKLRFNPDRIVIDNAWQWATTAGVEALQASLGEPETGSLALGQVVFLSGDRIVSTVTAGLGSAGGGGGPSAAGNSPATGSAGGAASATATLQTTSTQLIVTVDLDASKQSEARVGEMVTVEMPAGATVDGVITDVSPVAASSSSGSGGSSAAPGSQATIPVTIRLRGHISGAGLDQAPVSVNFAQAVANRVLSVPVTALLATPGGGYAVQRAQPPHQLIPVTTGLFAAGYVEISGPGVSDGLQVTNSQG